jgi:hypothetical protein
MSKNSKIVHNLIFQRPEKMIHIILFYSLKLDGGYSKNHISTSGKKSRSKIIIHSLNKISSSRQSPTLIRAGWRYHRGIL